MKTIHKVWWNRVGGGTSSVHFQEHDDALACKVEVDRILNGVGEATQLSQVTVFESKEEWRATAR